MGLVTSYDPRWPAFFEDERRRIATALTNRVVVIEHVRSTSVPGLAAKPVVDIAVAVDAFERERALTEPMEHIGYTYVPQYEAQDPMRRYFHRRVTDIDGFHGFHVHMYEAWHDDFLDYIRFREHLRTNAGDARRYEELKLRLGAEFPGERTRYQDEKRPFIDARSRHFALRGAEQAARKQSVVARSRSASERPGATPNGFPVSRFVGSATQTSAWCASTRLETRFRAAAAVQH